MSPSPTCGLEAAAHLLSLPTRAIRARIEDGSISHAWDISIAGRRRCIRILRRSLDRLRDLPPAVRRAHPLTDDAARALVLGRHTPALSTPQAARALCCSPQHILDLVASGALTLQPGTAYSRGPAGAAQIETRSLQQLLLSRRL